MKPVDQIQDRHELLFMGLMIILANLGLVVAALMSPSINQDVAFPFSWGVVLAVCGLTFLVSRYLGYIYPDYQVYLHPPVQISIWLLVSMLFPGMLGFYDPNISFRFVDYSELVAGWVVILQGVFALWFGYILGMKFFDYRRNQSESVIRPDVNQFICIIFYILLVSLVFLRIMVTGIAYGSNSANWGWFIIFDSTISYLDNSRYIFLIIALLGAIKYKWPKSISITFILVEICLALISGFTKPILWLILTLVATYHLSRFRISKRYFFLIGLAGIVATILGIGVVPIAEKIRENIGQYDNTSVTGAAEGVLFAYSTSWGQGLDVGWNIFADKMLGRQVAVSQMMGVIVAKTPKYVPHEGFERFFAIPTYIIPRFIHPDKPILSRGVWFSVNYLDMPENTVSSSAMTIFGETYIFSGILGTIFGLLILGILLSFIFTRYMRYSGGIILLTLLPTYLNIEGQYSTMVVALLQGMLVHALIYWLAVQFSQSPKYDK